ncbi:MAG: hypothetical protein K940chlam3_00177 [Chlamydiae bacterium]|nr:hypothetical protein [Chlamydiota bacterium]
MIKNIDIHGSQLQLDSLTSYKTLEAKDISFVGSEKEHKIVYMNSGPRALSTVFLRMMESRGDFIVYNEPTIPVYDRVHYRELTKEWFREDSYVTFDDVKKTIYDSAKKSHVFIKDMSFSSHDYILEDFSFMSDPRIHFIFLVRNPHHTSISFYRKNGGIVPKTSDLIGLQKLYEEYETIRKINSNGVKIIFSEQVYEEPKRTMYAYCDYLKIPFTEKTFKWRKHNEHFNGHNQWNEQKIGTHIHHWHGRAIESEKIGKPSIYEVDEVGNPTFMEISDDDHRSVMKEAYEENLIYYNKFIQVKEDHLLPLNEEK